MKQARVRIPLEVGGSLVGSALIIGIVIAFATFWTQAAGRVRLRVDLLGLLVVKLTRVAGRWVSVTNTRDMGLVWILGALLIFGLCEARWRLHRGE